MIRLAGSCMGRSVAIRWAVLWAALLSGCGGGTSDGPIDAGAWADRVIGTFAAVNPYGATEADWPQFFHPERALGPPGGTADTVSLGYDPAQAVSAGGALTLGLGSADTATPTCLEDGPGDDLAVYENPFHTVDPATSAEGTANEIATLWLAESDGGPWYEYPHSLDAALHPILPQRYTGFVGVVPVSEGGDRFDLFTLIDDQSLPADFAPCYVRIVDGGKLYPDYLNTQSDLWASGADIDAVQALHAVDAPGLTP